MANKKSVLFLIDSLTCGGAEKSLISLLPLLDYSKIEVDLMIVRRGGVFEQYIPSQVHVIDCPKSYRFWYEVCLMGFRVFRKLMPQRHGAESRWQIMSTAYNGLTKKYDVGISYQQGFPTYYLVNKVKASKKVAWINADITKVGYRPSFNRPFYDRIDQIVSVSDVLCQVLRLSDFLDWRKLYTVYDVLNVDLIKTMSKESMPFNKTANELIITTVGRMVALKGYDLAVKASIILREKGLLFHWFFVGGGEMESEISRMVSIFELSDFISLVGMTPNPYPYMAAADIYVQTSKFEGFGLTLNEARILNKPVISTDFPVVYNQIRDGENGLICEMTPESIANKILLLASDEPLRNKLIEATKKEVNSTSITEPQKVMSLILS
jgi:glycosyltransferase involved in cell wall biosynthesis